MVATDGRYRMKMTGSTDYRKQCVNEVPTRKDPDPILGMVLGFAPRSLHLVAGLLGFMALEIGYASTLEPH